MDAIATEAIMSEATWCPPQRGHGRRYLEAKLRKAAEPTPEQERKLVLARLQSEREYRSLIGKMHVAAWNAEAQWGCAVVMSRGYYLMDGFRKTSTTVRDTLGSCPWQVIDLVDEAERRYWMRQKRRAPGTDAEARYHDEINDRSPGNVVWRVLDVSAARTFRRASFRRGRAASHEIDMVACEKDVGLKVVSAPPGRTSYRFEVRVSRSFFRRPMALRHEEGIMYLSPAVRIVQGRGYTLREERLVDGKWTRSEQR